ncbi:MAG TPA: glycosyltransferase, partial [Acidimicrobiia bacterium]
MNPDHPLNVWITVPTLNEVENLDPLVHRIRVAVPDAHILIVDDGSADGTADKAEALGAELGGIEVLRRPHKMGLGSAYRASLLRAMDIETTHSTGYAFQIEMTYRVLRAGGRIEEVPISFTDRVRGTSKMSSRIVAEAMILVTLWALRDRVALRAGRRSAQLAQTAPAALGVGQPLRRVRARPAGARRDRGLP